MVDVKSSSTVAVKAPKAAPGDYNSVAAQYARAKAVKDAENVAKLKDAGAYGRPKSAIDRLNDEKSSRFKGEWIWATSFFLWLLFVHSAGIYFFTKGFLLTRLVLDGRSSCADPPTRPNIKFKGLGTHEAGCWHPKIFDKAVVVVIDALRYDFTVPYKNESAQAFHNALPFMYETSIKYPQNAFLLPFIADPPTTTLQRLKGLTTGTLPTFVDAGSNFAGTAIEEDNLLIQLKNAGRRIAHLGDDTWMALFPGYFEDGISKAYDSLNVWDLHTVDDGVTEHIIELVNGEEERGWDVLFAHYLGVDHAGHRYGPNHPAMTAKLRQMDAVLKELARRLDEQTLLVVLGDHGMDGKGDHGGESDDEVQAALWMYSKKGIFGRTDPAFVTPPQTAKHRPVNQIDLVPTLALLLGLPIPFNNLGRPIEEAFAGKRGDAWENLAAVARMTAAGIKRYQTAYYVARGIHEPIGGTPHLLWTSAEQALGGSGKEMWKNVYTSFSAFSAETLRNCRDLWARFDVPCMILGIGILITGIVSLVLYANGNSEQGTISDTALDRDAVQPEVKNFSQGITMADGGETTSRSLVRGALMGSLLGNALGPALWIKAGGESVAEFGLAVTVVSGLLGLLYQEMRRRMSISNPLPTTLWGWLGTVFTLSQSIGFASNSYTIWEDSILLFFISTFGIAAAAASLRIKNKPDMKLGVYHSVIFIVLGWVASFSQLCREEQMPYCRSTYYSSSTSSTSAPWQLVIPFMVAIALPSIVKSFYVGSRSYEGIAPIWIGWVFRITLVFSAIFWTLDAADDGEWLPHLQPGLLKNIRVPIAQTIFAVAIGAGSIGFIYTPPCFTISITTTQSSTALSTPTMGAKVTLLGFANTHGTRYMLLIMNILLCVLPVQKPMGAGALSLMTWQILSLVEILDLNSLTSSPIGPIMLALLGSFYFFKTGHQATLSSIQWESAFIPLHTIRYPYSPILVALNSFGAQIIAAAAVPLVVLWKQPPRKKGILKSFVAALAWHVSYYATMGLATAMWAALLRRHLMLYRIFSPKFMMAASVLLLVDLIGLVVALAGVRWNTLVVGNVFGWA